MADGKSWKGKLENSLNENPADLSEAVAEAFEIKTSANDIYIPSIYGESVSWEIAISVVYGAGLKEELKDADIDYVEYSDGDRYVIETEKSKYEIFGVGVYFLDVPCDLVIERVSGIQIRYTVSTDGGTVPSLFPQGYNTGDYVTVPAYTSTALMMRI